MADKIYKLTFELNNSTEKQVQFTAPQGEKGDKGATGATGPKGADGKTPVKGVDYWTSNDRTSMLNDVISALGGQPIFGVVDSNNNIILNGKLSEGTYTLKYESADGTITKIGTLNHSNAPATVSILDTYELQLNKRWSASGKKWSDCNGMVGILVPYADIKDKVVRFSGFVKDKTTSDSNSARWYSIKSDGTQVNGFFISIHSGNGTDDLWSANMVNEGNGTYSITIDDTTIARYADENVANIAMNMVINNTGTAITQADLASFSIVISEELGE